MKVVKIGKNEDLMFAIFKMMPPCFEGLNNGQKLTVVSFVSSFGRNHFMQEVGHQMPSAQVISQLTQHSTNKTRQFQPGYIVPDWNVKG